MFTPVSDLQHGTALYKRTHHEPIILQIGRNKILFGPSSKARGHPLKCATKKHPQPISSTEINYETHADAYFGLHIWERGEMQIYTVYVTVAEHWCGELRLEGTKKARKQKV